MKTHRGLIERHEFTRSEDFMEAVQGPHSSAGHRIST